MPKAKESGRRRVPPLSTSEARNLEQKALILQSLGQIVGKVSEPGSIGPGGRAEMQGIVELLCKKLTERDMLRLSEQEVSPARVDGLWNGRQCGSWLRRAVPRPAVQARPTLCWAIEKGTSFHGRNA